MDEVVFLDPTTGVIDGWTLGVDGDHEILFEPHNPDYLPATRGGHAVLVADSENDRVVEYHRLGDGWQLAWSWRDPTLQWPRDVDRLPDGHTLIVDSHGDRVVEIDTSGEIVWAVDVGRPYDAERMLTGDEIAEGFAAGSSQGGQDGGDGPVRAPPARNQGVARGGALIALKDALPGPLINGLLFVAPPWVDFTDLIVAFGLTLVLLGWVGAAVFWATDVADGPGDRLRRRDG